MSKVLPLIPGEGTQEVITKIKIDSSQPAPSFGSIATSPKNKKKGKHNAAPQSYPIKQPK